MIITTITLNKCYGKVFFDDIIWNFTLCVCVCECVFECVFVCEPKFINFYPMCDVLKNNLTNIVQQSVNVIKNNNNNRNNRKRTEE